MAAEAAAGGAGATSAGGPRTGQRRVFMCMGWGGGPDGIYFPFLKKHFEEKGAWVHAVELPTDTGEISKYTSNLSSLVAEHGGVDANTYFLGQSVGNQVILRFLASLAGAVRIGGWVAMAGWLDIDKKTTAKRDAMWDDFVASSWDKLGPWCDQTTVDWDAAKVACDGKVKLIIGDDDPIRALDSHGEDNAKEWRDKLGAETVIRPGRGHYITTELTEEEVAEIDATILG